MLHLSVSPISHFCHQTWLLYVLPADVFACPSLKEACTVRPIKYSLDFSSRGRTRGSRHKLQHDKLQLDVRKKIFTGKMAKHWKKLFRNTVLSHLWKRD